MVDLDFLLLMRRIEVEGGHKAEAKGEYAGGVVAE